MSTFCGQFSEIPNISVDRFDGNNLQSKIFFLSHCHTDHMVGLYNSDGLPGPLYLSNVSAMIIRQQFPNIRNLITLNLGEATVVNYDSSDNSSGKRLTVTAMTAAHCPGSVMFLFEQDDLKVLYTGDFRLRLKEIEKMGALRNGYGTSIKLDALYVDSTFLSKAYLDFPTQWKSADIICDLISAWLSRGPKYKISLRTAARYGYESLFLDIYKRLHQPIHVNQSELRKYNYVAELDGCFTSDGEKSRIHACFSVDNKNSLRFSCDTAYESKFIRLIRPTAMIWQNWDRGEPIYEISDEQAKQFVRVCYSNHASYTEIKELITFLKPKRVLLNVVPESARARTRMLDELAEIQGLYEPKELEFSRGVTLDFRDLQPVEFRNIDFNNMAPDTVNVSEEDNDVVLDREMQLVKRRKAR